MTNLASSPVDYKGKALRRLADLPPFSPVLNQLLACVAEEDVSIARVATVIEKDTVLAGNVLRIVNSALYGRRGTINSVRHAVSLLGVAKLRNTAMTLSVSQLWNGVRTPPSWSPKRFNIHSVATAIMADLLAQRLPVDYAEGAFAAGLLHDVGLLLTAISLPEEFEEIRRMCDRSGYTIPEAEKKAIGMCHSSLSAAVLAAWNLPQPIQRAVLHRHEPNGDADEVTLSRVLQVADRAVELLGLNALDCQPQPADQPVIVFESLHLEGMGARILDEFEREFEPIRGFF